MTSTIETTSKEIGARFLELTASSAPSSSEFKLLKAAIQRQCNVGPGTAASAAMKARPDLYTSHLAALGVVRDGQFRAQLKEIAIRAS